MSRDKLKYLATKTLKNLRSNVMKNVDRYRAGSFDDLISMGGWNIELSIEIDLEFIASLDPSGTPSAEVENSLLVWKALFEMTPALACEERIWARLSHVECLEYSRARWLNLDAEDEQIEKDTKTHFFAPTQTGCRDDHAISRLWWNARIAKNIRPSDQRGALQMILKTADIRSSFVERSWIVSRPPVANSILRAIERYDWLTSSESNFREFMKSLNHKGGGVAFELLSSKRLDRFMDDCVSIAQDKIASE